MLPDKLIVNYMDSYFLKPFSFYDKSRKVNGCSLLDWSQSYLNEKILIINFRKEHFYTQAMSQLTQAPFNYMNRFYILVNPRDKEYSAGAPFRN